MHCVQPKRTLSSGELQRALERFDWIVEEVRDLVCGADAGELGEVLGDEGARTSAKERALVTLGLMATARAEAALRWWDSTGEHPRVRILHRLANRECSRRRGAAARAFPQASSPKPRARLTQLVR